MSKFLKNINFWITTQRAVSHRVPSNRRYNWRDEGIQYPGFKYYPRYPDFKDPPYEPSKLLRIQRIKSLRGVPHYDKKMLEHFKLTEKLSDVVVVKNIPENNQRLWKIKHLIKIVPITFPDGFPTDTRRTYLQENGELRVVKILEPIEQKLQLTEKFENNPEKLDGHTLRRDSRKKWLSGWY